MEKYKIYAYSADGSRIEIGVMAQAHMQYEWSSTELVGCSKAGKKKLLKLKNNYHRLNIEIAGREIRLANF